MKNVFDEFIATYGVTILWGIVTFIAGYVAIGCKALYTKFINTKIKKDVVKTCVQAVEQIYVDLHGEDKLNKCITAAAGMLNEKGISIGETELRLLIEAAVNEFNNKFDFVELGNAIEIGDEAGD